MQQEDQLVITNDEMLKSSIISMFNTLLNAYREDIETGIKDGTYEKSENVETRAFIAEAKKAIAAFEKATPTVHCFVSGGIVQAVYASEEVNFNLFDKDNFDGGDEGQQQEFIEAYGHPDKWDDQIQGWVEAKEITLIQY